MSGCLRRAGCLAVIVLAIIAGGAVWITRRWWMPMFGFGAAGAIAQPGAWQAPAPDGAKRVESALAGLQRRSGPVFANVEAGDLLAFIMKEFSRSMPPSTDSIQGAVVGERLHIRARVRTADLGSAIGTLAALVSDRERIELGGTLHVIKPGLSEFQVKSFRIRDLPLPEALLPALVRQLDRNRPPGLSPDGLPLYTPTYIGDVRVANGRITLYKTQ